MELREQFERFEGSELHQSEQLEGMDRHVVDSATQLEMIEREIGDCER